MGAFCGWWCRVRRSPSLGSVSCRHAEPGSVGGGGGSVYAGVYDGAGLLSVALGVDDRLRAKQWPYDSGLHVPLIILNRRK